jgi:hypothetical protein
MPNHDYKPIRECVYETIHRNEKSLKQIAEDLGIEPNTLTRYGLPDFDEKETGSGYAFPLKHLSNLVKSTNNYSVLDAIEQSVGRVGVPLPPPNGASTADVCRLTMRSVTEFGEFISEIERSVDDDTIKPSERKRIIKEGYEAVQAILALMEACRGEE